jgi:hypothetical protein
VIALDVLGLDGPCPFTPPSYARLRCAALRVAAHAGHGRVGDDADLSVVYICNPSCAPLFLVTAHHLLVLFFSLFPSGYGDLDLRRR